MNCWEFDSYMITCISSNHNDLEKNYSQSNSECDMFSSCLAMDHCFDGIDDGCNDN